MSEFKVYDEYLDLVDQGKPISKEIGLMLKRVPEYLNKFDFRPSIADMTVTFIEGAMFTQKGAETKPFKLQLEQKFIIYMAYSFYYPDTNKRVIKELPLIFGAGSGKSTLTASLAISRMIIGSERGADVLVLANTKEQAQETFGTASKIIRDERSEVFTPLYKSGLLNPIINRIKYEPTNSEISVKALDDKSADGVNVAMTIFDEIHAYKAKDGAVIANIRKSASAKRPNDFLMVFISTNGVVRGEAFDDLYKRWLKVLNGEVEDYSVFPMIYKLDDISEVADPSMYEKALPFVRSISDPQSIYEMAMQTKGNPTAQAQVISKVFNIPQNSYNALFTTKVLEQARQPIEGIDWGNKVLVGIDMGSTNDLTSISFVSRVLLDEGYKYRVRNISFIPRATFEKHNNKELYRKFEKEGSLIILDGTIINQDEVFNHMETYISDNNLDPLYFGYDNWNIKQLLNHINTYYGDYYTHRIPQVTRELSAPLQRLATEIKSGNVWLDSDLLKWSFNNLRVKVDGNGNIFPNKEKSADKIDPVASTIDSFWLMSNIDDINLDLD